MEQQSVLVKFIVNPGEDLSVYFIFNAQLNVQACYIIVLKKLVYTWFSILINEPKLNSPVLIHTTDSNSRFAMAYCYVLLPLLFIGIIWGRGKYIKTFFSYSFLNT